MPPARQQVDRETLEEYLKERRPEGGTYNIWHNRWKGLERDWSKKGLRAKFKCNVARDSGETVGSSNRNAYFCLFFAKGMCAQGAHCPMWHRIPNEHDEIETTIDCFGRDKYMEFRQDMGGVGGFNTQNKTLYVGRIAPTENMWEIVRKHFGQFGEIERLKVIKHRGVAFVTYRSRSNAEFAREAMMNQGLDNSEILNVRWATAEQDASSRGGDGSRDINKQQGVVMPPIVHGQQDTESELPAEYSHVKREVAEDSFQEMEERAKRKRLEYEAAAQYETSAQYYYDTESTEALYGYTAATIGHQQEQLAQAAAAAAAAAASASQEQTKAGGIIPLNVLNNLKTLTNPSGANGSAAKKDEAAKENGNNKSGLGNLADYGSDSESEDEKD
ncbi:hypothetical protein BX666DRAFT_2029821 [Dichotomocladium elegans]|nr:hypothetical protein BX666DRAFT_2029821 [Dichotomocladium elegans]